MQMPGMDTVEDIQQLVNEAFLLQARDLFAQIHLMTQNRVKEINSGDR